MANTSKRADQGIRASRKSKAIVAAVVVVFSLVIVGYFIYISGLLPKVMTGVKITKTEEGVTRTIENISVAETNYHYYQVLNSYYSYGIINNSMNMDDVYDTTTGKTYRQLILDQAASELMNITVINQEAEERGYLPHSAAQRYARMSLESAEQMATLYNFPSVEQYYQQLYGRGMSSRIMRESVARETLTQEYENYVRQFLFTVSEEELNAAYEANPTVYQRADFNYYFFAGEANEDGTYDVTQAVANANEVADNATDSDSFAACVVDIIGEETAEIAGFTEDSNPTFVESYTDDSANAIAEGLGDFIFDDARVAGDTTVIETESGAYAVLFGSKYVRENPTVTYRTLTLYNDAAQEEGATPESIAAGLAEVQAEAQSLIATPMDSLAFADVVKNNTDVLSEIITGGYNDGTTADRFEGTEEAPVSDRDAQLGAWLFDAARVHGDTLVLPSEDSSYVTVYYFEDSIPEWMYTARTQLVTGMVNSWSNDMITDATSYAIAYDLIEKLQ